MDTKSGKTIGWAAFGGMLFGFNLAMLLVAGRTNFPLAVMYVAAIGLVCGALIVFRVMKHAMRS